jgi:hypothetical protein
MNDYLKNNRRCFRLFLQSSIIINNRYLIEKAIRREFEIDNMIVMGRPLKGL